MTVRSRCDLLKQKRRFCHPRNPLTNFFSVQWSNLWSRLAWNQFLRRNLKWPRTSTLWKDHNRWQVKHLQAHKVLLKNYIPQSEVQVIFLETPRSRTSVQLTASSLPVAFQLKIPISKEWCWAQTVCKSVTVPRWVPQKTHWQSACKSL